MSTAATSAEAAYADDLYCTLPQKDKAPSPSRNHVNTRFAPRLRFVIFKLESVRWVSNGICSLTLYFLNYQWARAFVSAFIDIPVLCFSSIYINLFSPIDL